MNEVVDLGLTLCSALECIHKASVIHRDIKPSNLGFTLDGRLKVMDFGLATVLQETSRTSATHEIITKENLDPIKDMARSRIAGTLPYLSPEALRGAPPDFSFDIWSTCVVLYEAASGVHPFWRKTARETWSAIQEAEATPIDTVWPSCPDAARRFFDSAFSLDMKKRPQTATQLRSCLTSLL